MFLIDQLTHFWLKRRSGHPPLVDQKVVRGLSPRVLSLRVSGWALPCAESWFRSLSHGSGLHVGGCYKAPTWSLGDAIVFLCHPGSRSASHRYLPGPCHSEVSVVIARAYSVTHCLSPVSSSIS